MLCPHLPYVTLCRTEDMAEPKQWLCVVRSWWSRITGFRVGSTKHRELNGWKAQLGRSWGIVKKSPPQLPLQLHRELLEILLALCLMMFVYRVQVLGLEKLAFRLTAIAEKSGPKALL